MTGITNLDDKVTEYRKTILNKMINSEKIIELIGGVPAGKTADQLIDVNFFDTEYIPESGSGTTETAKVLIGFDLKINYNPKNVTYKNIDIHFYISTHKDSMRASDKSLICDGIVHELETIFNNKPILGVGKGSFYFNRPYKPADMYRGRVLCLKIIDYNMGV